MHCECPACTVAVKHALFMSGKHCLCQVCTVGVKHARFVSGMQPRLDADFFAVIQMHHAVTCMKPHV